MSDPRAFILADALKALGINPDDNPVYHAKRWIEGRDADRRERDQAITGRDNAAARVAARDLRVKDLESALLAIGVNVHNDLQGEVSAIHNRSAGDSAAAQHDLDCALRERDAAQAKIASNVADLAARDMRIADLERDLAAKDATLKTAHAALKRICEVIGAPVPCVAEDAVEAVKTLLCTSEGHNLRADRAEETLAEMVKALDDAGAPQAYHLDDDTKRAIPDPERIRLLGERVHTLRAQIREVSDATNYLDALIEAHNALDSLNAPRLADGFVLSLAARIRSLPC